MDLGHIFNGAFSFGLVNIIFINIILSGDNAVVIAMAVRSLPRKERQWGIILGTAGAVILRTGLTFVAARFLEVSFIKLTGGLLILWIAVKLLFPESENENVKEVIGLRRAIVIILVADLVMSLDNVLGVAGAANGNPFLLFSGCGISLVRVISILPNTISIVNI